MLLEIMDVRQVRGEGKRRWFSDDYFDLIVWYEKDDRILGFQLCYNIREDEHALTWRREIGWSHDKIDAGEKSAWQKMTPILVADGLFPKEAIAARFQSASVAIEPGLSEFVYKKILEYPR